ncbi:MAG: hypothetical protein V2B20_00365, partial [Pseudomonadota bacterium]
KLIALSRSAVRWENKKKGNAGFQKKRDGAGGSVLVSGGGSVLISVEDFVAQCLFNENIFLSNPLPIRNEGV